MGSLQPHRRALRPATRSKRRHPVGTRCRVLHRLGEHRGHRREPRRKLEPPPHPASTTPATMASTPIERRRGVRALRRDGVAVPHLEPRDDACDDARVHPKPGAAIALWISLRTVLAGSRRGECRFDGSSHASMHRAMILSCERAIPSQRMERAAGIEPATLAWKARALPLCNARAQSVLLRSGGACPLRHAPPACFLVGRAGFEPAYRLREPGLQPGAINHSTTDPRCGPALIREVQPPFLLCAARHDERSRENSSLRADVAQWSRAPDL